MPNLSIWRQALSRMPKMPAEQWQQLDLIAKWLIATRASVFVMTFSSAALGGLLALRDGLFQFQPWLLAILGLIFAHATNNLLNDYSDSSRGVDKDNYFRNQYGVHVLEDGLMSRAQFMQMVTLTGAIALAFGGWLVWERSGATFNLMLAGAFFVLFYTWPLKYFGLGEPAVLLVWGPLMVGGTYYVISGQWSWDVTWLSCLYALGPTSVLFGKHTDKLEMDRTKGVRTLPVILGEKNSRRSVQGMMIAQYLLCAGLVVSGKFHWALLLVFLNLPKLLQTLRAYQQPRPLCKPEDYPDEVWPLWFVGHAFRHNRLFSGYFLLGLLIDIALR